MTFNNFPIGLFLFTLVSFCHTKQCFLEKHPCISEFKLWTLDANLEGFVEVSLPSQPLTISRYSIRFMSLTSMHEVQLSEDPDRNRKYAMCNIALREDLDDHQPWAIELLERGTVIDDVIYVFNYSDSRAQALANNTGPVENVLVYNKSLSVSRCGSSYVQSFPTMWVENNCPTYIDVLSADDSVDEMDDGETDAAASPPRSKPNVKPTVSNSSSLTNSSNTSTKTSSTQPSLSSDSIRQPTSTSPSSSAATKHHLISPSPSTSTQPTSPKSSAATKYQPTSPSASASTQPTSPKGSASTKHQPTSPSSSASTQPTSPKGPASTKHQPPSPSSSASTQPTSPKGSASTKHQPTSPSASASTQPTSPKGSASTKHQPASPSASASTQPTSPKGSASTKHQPTSPSASASTQPTSPKGTASTKHQPTSPSASASTQPTSPNGSATPKHQQTSLSSSASTFPRSSSSIKQPTSLSSSASTQPTSPRSPASPKQSTPSSSHSPITSEHGTTETARTEVSSSSSGSTNRVSVTASSPPTPPSTVAPFPQNPVINEVGILVRNDVNSSFIELRALCVMQLTPKGTPDYMIFALRCKGPNMTLDNCSLVVFDGKSKETLFHKRFGKHDVINGTGIFVVHYFLKHHLTANDSSVAVALYDNSKWLQQYSDVVPINQIHGLLDSFIMRTTEEDIHTDILENLVPQSTKRIFTVNPSLLNGRSHVSLSRCLNDTKDPGSFTLAPSTIGRSNNCTTGYGNRVQFKLSNANCDDFRSNRALQQSLVDVIVNSVNDKCKCGLSRVLVKKRKYICGSLIFEAYLESSFPWQSHLIFHGFRNFVRTSNTVIVGPRSYIADSTCYQDCLPPATKPSSKDNDNVTLTVAVVVSCFGVFLVIAMGVIIYIRRKKRGIVTFRLTNLGELDTSGMLHDDKDDLIVEDNATFRTMSLKSVQ